MEKETVLDWAFQIRDLKDQALYFAEKGLSAKQVLENILDDCYYKSNKDEVISAVSMAMICVLVIEDPENRFRLVNRDAKLTSDSTTEESYLNNWGQQIRLLEREELSDDPNISENELQRLKWQTVADNVINGKGVIDCYDPTKKDGKTVLFSAFDPNKSLYEMDGWEWINARYDRSTRLPVEGDNINIKLAKWSLGLLALFVLAQIASIFLK